MPEIIETKNLTKIYGKGHTEVRALDGINLSVEKGEFLVVMGPSGSGKTTLLNMLGALDKPTSGEVFIDEVQVSKVPERKLYKVRREKLGFVFQTYYLVPTLNALENVLVPTLPIRTRRVRNRLPTPGVGRGNPRGFFGGRARMLLAEVGLAKRAHHKPSQLSGGEQQRVAIARALILDPPIVLADEPTGNLDSETGREIIDLMRRLDKEKGKTFVTVTHDPAITKHADRTLELLDGKIKES